MDNKEFRALLDLLICSDPWPVADPDNKDTLMAWADRQAIERGYSGFIEALHNHRG